MKNGFWLAVLPSVVLPFTAIAQEASGADKQGYSYFTFGMENVNYEEYHQGTTSSVTIVSPMLNTGGLYHVNEKFDFSIDTMATFSPVNYEEEWRWNGDLLQKNQFEYLKASTHVMLHYKVDDHWRALAGGSLTYQTYTRYDAEKFAHVEQVFEGTWEEKTTSLFLDAGVAYDNGTLWNNEKWRLMGRWTVGIPLYSVTENTQFPEATFNNFAVRTNLEGTLSYQVMPGLHLGWYAALGYEYRFESDCQTVMMPTDSEDKWVARCGKVPDAATLNFNTGLQALWHF